MVGCFLVVASYPPEWSCLIDALPSPRVTSHNKIIKNLCARFPLPELQAKGGQLRTDWGLLAFCAHLRALLSPASFGTGLFLAVSGKSSPLKRRATALATGKYLSVTYRSVT